MPTEIFDALENAAEWHSVLRQLPESLRDVYFLPEYVALHCFEQWTKALLFVYHQAEAIWAYPFLLQPIRRVGEIYLEPGLYDVETAYGYGGPVANTDKASFLGEAHTAFSTWCQKKGVIAEFVRLHPLLETHHWLDPQVELIYDRTTVSLQLSSLEERRFRPTVRNKLRRARDLGIHVTVQPAHEGFEKFAALYTRTMAHLEAESFYFFNETYFSDLGEFTKTQGWLLSAELDQEWLGSAVFLKGAHILHYHLSATDPDKRVPGVVNLLLAAAARLGAQDGLRRMHLGGGRSSSPDDSLLEFKRSMASDEHVFYVGRRIHKPQVYACLRELWAREYPTLVPVYNHRLLCYRCARL